ncbi:MULTISPECIES: DUF6221 family protein [Streptomyces rochei group]|uniref:DUF6221 family protein n=1 Tax=Streptomyces rochei group TaxID=2867164 RepID=UPI001877249B|nr:DUF6221 family protein [Streptomyces vinaceusdrappus]GHC37226.1 hypothetical protein GCM10010308_64740 [Streptomyces vinaceusdrappus]
MDQTEREMVAFVRARLHDDEGFMRAAIRLRDSGAVTSSSEATEGAFALMDVVLNDADTVEALSVFTRTGARAPGEAERVLEEVEAKRKRMNILVHALEAGHDSYDLASELLPLEALPYASHPDYKESWRP